MTIEHVALNVSDPVALADWYTQHLGMRVVRAVEESPFTRFIADGSGRTVLEVYKQSPPVPDYPAQHVFTLHVAFVSADVTADRDRLLAAGATAAGEITLTPAGDEMTFVRDPWGIVIQLVKRARPLL